MKLTDKQQDILYLVISIIVGILLGVSVYLIIKHIRSKKCDDINPCPFGQICQKNGKCINNEEKCSCDGKNCGEDNGCGTTCDGSCPNGQTCQNKKCVDNGSNCSCDGKNCGEDNGCGTKCNVPCANGAICKPNSSEPCKIDPKPDPAKTCTDDKHDPYETGKCKPCCDGIQMYKIKGSSDRYICSSTKPESDTLSSDNPFVNNICPPTPIEPQPTPSSPVGKCTKNNKDPYETNNCLPCCDGLQMYKIQEGQSPARFICSSSKPNNLTPKNPYINTCPPEPSGSGGGSGGWKGAKKCSDIGVTKASSCGNQRYVCAYPDKNKIPDCKSIPFNCPENRTKCLND